MGRAIAVLCGVVSIVLAGCSTIVKGTQQQVSVSTPGVQGAMCQLASPGIGTRTVKTPANIILPKSKHNVAVTCTAQCYSDGVATLASHTEIMTAGNVLFGGIIGLGVDAASGAMNKYDPSVEVVMSPIPRCGQPPGRGRACPCRAHPSGLKERPARQAEKVSHYGFRSGGASAKRASYSQKRLFA